MGVTKIIELYLSEFVDTVSRSAKLCLFRLKPELVAVFLLGQACNKKKLKARRDLEKATRAQTRVASPRLSSQGRNARAISAYDELAENYPAACTSPTHALSSIHDLKPIERRAFGGSHSQLTLPGSVP